jgi:hypothetical protein
MGTDWYDGAGTAPRQTTRYALVGQSAFKEIAATTCDLATRCAGFCEGEPRLAPRSLRDAVHWQIAPIRSRYRLARLKNQSKCCTIHADGEMRVEWLEKACANGS